MILTCECCGAVLLQQAVTRIDEVIGQNHAKRALEVALVGDHSIAFIADGNLPDARLFARIASGLGLSAWATTRCWCGHPRGHCLCSPEMVDSHHATPAFQNAITADLVIGIPIETGREIFKYHESDEVIHARAADAKQRVLATNDLTPEGELLLKTGARHLSDHFAGTENRRRILRVAGSIARLDERDRIATHHVAEAMQYHWRW